MVKIYESVPEHSLYLTCKLNLARVVVVHRLFMFLPSDRDADEVDERAGVINGVAKALDKRMDKLNEKLAAIEKSLAALKSPVALERVGSTAGPQDVNVTSGGEEAA